jgi:hypothetical protein
MLLLIITLITLLCSICVSIYDFGYFNGYHDCFRIEHKEGENKE